MSIKLPQEHRTSKLETLPKDLRSKADALIAKKFNLKEEVKPKQAPPFLGEEICRCGPQYAQRCPIHDSSYGRGFGVDFGYGPDVQTRSDFYRRIEEISIYVRGRDSLERALYELMHEADRRNWPRNRRFVMSHGMADELKYQIKRNSAWIEGTSMTILGCGIEVGYGIDPQVIKLQCRY